MLPLKAEDILIRAQATPNPFAFKFITNMSLKTEGKATFTSPESASNVRVAADLLAIPGIVQVHFFQNSVTVTQDGSLADEDFRQQVLSVLETRLPIHNPDFDVAAEKSYSQRNTSTPELAEIEEILDRTVRLGLQADGGDLEVIDYVDHTLTINYEGACGSCPSSLMGTLDAIQSILQHEFDPELRVETL